MSKHLERDLENLQRELLTMAAEVNDLIHRAVLALRATDDTMARQVIAGDQVVDRRDNLIEEECLKLVALHQPVASDLRRIMVSFKINNELERMADLAVSIAGRAEVLARLPRVTVSEALRSMTDVTTMMVRQALNAFVYLDSKLARAVIDLDDQVDGLNDDLIAECLVQMRATEKLAEPALSMFSAVRALERIADHATNIAEDVVYLVEGDIIRHSSAFQHRAT